MVPINHDIFITITKYCRPSDLKQIAGLSKECNDIVQPIVDYMFDLKECLEKWLRSYIREFVKPLESKPFGENGTLLYPAMPPNDTPAFRKMEDIYAAAVIVSKKRFGIKT